MSVAAAGAGGGYKTSLSLRHQLTAAAGSLREFGSLPPSPYLDVRRLPPPPPPPAPPLSSGGLIAPPPWFL